MGDDELEEIRRRKIAQLQQQSLEQQEEAERQRKVDSQIQLILMQILEPAARERLNTIRLTRPEFARAVEQQLVALGQSGRLAQKITDVQLKELLRQLSAGKREFRITRK
ncbi:MAG: DNA-binding protein [Methanoregulaceae archaeon]|nr:DNA-binding protein [Methanoregulaceae archaeon]